MIYNSMVSSKVVFGLKTIALLVLVFWSVIYTAQAQVTDTIYQKPTLNNGMPPAEVSPQVIIKEPEKPKPVKETSKESKAQESKETSEQVPFRERFFTGGGFGLAFGNYTNLQLAPVLGYKITDWFAGGVGLTYIYIKDDFGATNYLGKKVFLQGMIYKGVFAHTEYENFSSLQDKYNVNAALAGLGYRQMMSNRVGLDLMLLLNLDQSVRSAYGDPLVYRFGLYIDLK